MEGHAALPGVHLFYRTMGRGEPILFLHGGPALPHGYFLPWVEPLAREHRLIFFDQRGVGRSGKPKDVDYRVAVCARDVEELRRVLHLGQVHLFGFSWGGALALEFAIRYPNSLRSLTVAEGFANTEKLNERLLGWLADAPANLRSVVERCERVGLFAPSGGYVPEYDAAVAEIYPRNPEHPPDWTPPPSYVEAVKNLAWDVYRVMWGQDGEFRITGTLAGWDALSRMPRLKVPVLFLVSRYGMWTPREASALAKQLPRARTEVFEHSGHLMFADEPGRFIDVMEAFLKGARRPPNRRSRSARVARAPSGSRSRGT